MSNSHARANPAGRGIWLMMLAVVGLSMTPIFAVCESARIVSSIYPRGVHSYLVTPGVTPGPGSSSVTADVGGSFWALGAGDAEPHVGCDSGEFRPIGEHGWVKRPDGYPAFINTTWARDASIDNCISDVQTEEQCVAVLVTDQVSDSGYYALLTAAHQRRDYSLVQPGNAPITLALIPTPILDGLVIATTTGLVIPVRVEAPAGGTYLDTSCATAITGYRIHYQATAQSGPLPQDRRRSSGWAALTPASTTSLGSTVATTITCAPGSNVYLTASLVFDSGYETPHVSANSVLIPCDH